MSRCSSIRRPFGAVCAAALLQAGAAHADPTGTALGTVTVQGLSYGSGAVALPSTASVMDQARLTEGQPQVNLSETLSEVPGVVVNNRQDYAQDMQMSIRGFGSDSTFGVQNVYVTLDGIPLTMPDGQGQVQVIDLPTIGGIQVIKGPFTTLYGNSAGGVLEAWTRDAPEAPSASLRSWWGADSSHQTTLVGGATVGSVGALAGLTDFSTDGSRAHSAADRKQFNGTLNWGRGDDQYSLVLNALDQDAQDPGGLTRAEFQRNPQGVDPAMLSFDTRKTTSNRLLGLSWDHRFDADDKLSTRVYTGTRDIVQYLPMLGNTLYSAGGVVALDDYFGGGGSQYSHAGTLAQRPYTLAAGVDYGRENEFRKGYENVDGSQGSLRNDQFNTVDNLAQYMQLHWQWSPALGFSGGLRHDQVRFGSSTATDVPAAMAPGTGGGASYGSTDPVAGLLFQIDSRNSLYADIGTGFVTPTFYQLAYRPDGQPGLNFALQPMHLHNSEVGWRSQHDGWSLQASAFDIGAQNQIIVDTSVNGRTTYENAGESRRYGADLSLQATLPAHLSAHLAYNVMNVYFVGGPYNGNTLPGAPRQQLDLGLTWRPPLQQPALQGFYSTLSWLARSQVFVNAQNSAAAQGYGALNWSTGVEQSHGPWQLSEFLRVDNVLNQDYIAAVVIADSNGRYFEAGPGRNVTAGVELTRGF
jgi:iron complex outermembrane receptor protein